MRMHMLHTQMHTPWHLNLQRERERERERKREKDRERDREREREREIREREREQQQHAKEYVARQEERQYPLFAGEDRAGLVQPARYLSLGSVAQRISATTVNRRFDVESICPTTKLFKIIISRFKGWVSAHHHIQGLLKRMVLSENALGGRFFGQFHLGASKYCPDNEQQGEE